MIIKGLAEACSDENQFLQCLDGVKRYENLLKAISENIIGLEEQGISYHLQLESVQLMIMVLSSPLYGRSSKILDKMLNGPLTEVAPKLSQKLCQRFMGNIEAPLDIYEPGSEKAGGGSLVLSLASGLWNILTFGYSSVAANQPTGNAHMDEELWTKTPLADLSVLLLLLLINHSSSAVKTENAAPEDHCYRLALYHCYSHKGTAICLHRSGHRVGYLRRRFRFYYYPIDL